MNITKSSVKSLKPGKYCVIDGEPCKVLSVSISAPGKHGGAKARLDAVGIFDERKRSIVKPADTEIDVPIVEKKSAQVVAITGDMGQFMDMETYETFDMKIPEELKGKIQQGSETVYWIILDRKLLVG
jgi:translation initiation factor 5A